VASWYIGRRGHVKNARGREVSRAPAPRAGGRRVGSSSWTPRPLTRTWQAGSAAPLAITCPITSKEPRGSRGASSVPVDAVRVSKIPAPDVRDDARSFAPA
jgi:hypothetical protein